MRWSPCATDTSTPPSARMGHVAVAVDARQSWGDEIVVVHGGLSEGKYALADVVVFQTEGNAWTRPDVPSTGPHARAFHCATVVNTKIFVFGGHVWVKEKKGLQKFQDLWCLSTDSWEWSQVELPNDAVQPSARDFACIVALDGGRLLIHGGLDAKENRLDDAWLFDTMTSTWSEVRANGIRPKPRYGHTMCRVDSRVLMFGGENNASLANDLWTLRGLGLDGEESPSWFPLELPGTAPAPRKGHACASVGLWLVVMGGRTADVTWFLTRTDAFLNDVVIMDRAGTVQWQSAAVAGDMPAAREFHTFSALSDGRVLLFGGGNGKQIFGDSWWLDTEGQAPVESALSDHTLQAYLAASAKAAPRGGRLANLQAPHFINNALSVFKDRQNASEAERDSLTSLTSISDFPASPSAVLIPSTAQLPIQATQPVTLTPQHPGLTHLRRKLGLPLQDPSTIPSSVQPSQGSSVQVPEGSSNQPQQGIPAQPQQTLSAQFQQQHALHGSLVQSDQQAASEQQDQVGFMQGDTALQQHQEPTARHFSTLNAGELKLSEVSSLVSAYQTAARSQQHTYIQQLWQQDFAGSGIASVSGRFCHCSAETLRLGDLYSMLHELQHAQTEFN